MAIRDLNIDCINQGRQVLEIDTTHDLLVFILIFAVRNVAIKLDLNDTPHDIFVFILKFVVRKVALNSSKFIPYMAIMAYMCRFKKLWLVRWPFKVATWPQNNQFGY